jgi:hypothetical protein
VNDTDRACFEEWVREHIARFYTDDDYINMNVRLKEDHIRRVRENIVSIGRELDLDLNALLLADTTALFHDIGRFEQFKKYRTFNDARSENHALLSVRILQESGLLQRLPPEEREVVSRTIRFHNVRSIPQGESADVLFHAKLLRDADKLDIFFVVTDYYTKRSRAANPAVELDLPDLPEYSSRIIADIMAGRCTDGSNLRTYNDMKLFGLSWVFDINFRPTLRRLHDRRYIQNIIDELPDTADIRAVKNHIEKYVSKTLQSE